MRSSSLIFVSGIIIMLVIDGILYYQLKYWLQKKWLSGLYIFHTLFFIGLVFLFQYFVTRLNGPEGYFWIEKIIGITFLFYVPKLVFILFNGIGRLFQPNHSRVTRAFLQGASILSGCLFLLLLYSLTIGRYHYKTDTVEVPFSHLPAGFNHFKIVQLSDLHLGSFGESYRGVDKLVREVNNLQPDLIVFTGDMVNNFAGEMLPWISAFQQLKAPYGKYAVTGNHDYGDYTRWVDPAAKAANRNNFFKYMQEMGFQMLNNTYIPLISGTDTLWLAGVENWGNPPFPRYGQLSKALDSLRDNQFVIMLSHDPSHWHAELLQHKIPLTLSGHTHAMQFGIKIKGFHWSPSKYLYPEYDGLYRQGDQYIYVSRGQGYLGFPGRIGLRPVITELILVKSTDTGEHTKVSSLH